MRVVAVRTVGFSTLAKFFLDKLVTHGFPKTFVQGLRRRIPEIYGKIPGEKNTRKICENDRKTVHWVLPFHPDVAAMKLESVANKILEKYSANIKVCASWAIAQKNMSDLMREAFTEKNWHE